MSSLKISEFIHLLTTLGSEDKESGRNKIIPLLSPSNFPYNQETNRGPTEGHIVISTLGNHLEER